MWIEWTLAEGFWLLLFLAVAALSRLALISTSWSGVQAVLNGKKHWLCRIEKSGALVALEVGVRCQSAAQWQCQRETSVDRWAKRRGMSREIQTGDEHFDREIYVFADDEKAADLLKTSADLRASIIRMIGSGASWLRCQDGWVVAYFVESWRPTTQQRADAALPILHAVAEMLRPSEVSRYNVVMDAVRDRATCWIAAAIAMPIVAFVMVLAGGNVRYLGGGSLIAPAFALSLLSALLLAGFGVALLWGTSRFHRIGLRIWWIGLPGCLLLGFALASHINKVGKQPPATVIEALVLEKKARAGGKSTAYSLRIDSSLVQRFNSRNEMPVDAGIYDRVQVGMRVQWKVRQGAFGAPWIESVRIQPDEVSR